MLENTISVNKKEYRSEILVVLVASLIFGSIVYVLIYDTISEYILTIAFKYIFTYFTSIFQ